MCYHNIYPTDVSLQSHKQLTDDESCDACSFVVLCSKCSVTYYYCIALNRIKKFQLLI